VIFGRCGAAAPPPFGCALLSPLPSAAGLASAAGAAPPSAACASAAGVASAFAGASAFVALACFAPSAFGFAFASLFGAAFFAFAGAFVALAPFENAFAASASSTLEDAVVTSSPAFCNAARASFEVIPCSFAISWTRFFAMR